MKKTLISFLLCLALTTLFMSNTFAMDSYEPNNTPATATFIAPGSAHFANLDAGDFDHYLFSPPTAGTQYIHFIPGDNQTYYVGIYDYNILGYTGGSASPLAYQIISNSQGIPAYLSFTAQANTAYWVRVFGNNTATTGTYILLGNF